MVAGFAARLGPFLRHPLDPGTCRERLKTFLRDRKASFLSLLERGISDQTFSLYRALPEHAGCELGDVRAMIAADDLEGQLGAADGERVGRGRAMRVQRRQPHATGVAKILPLHLIGVRDTSERS